MNARDKMPFEVTPIFYKLQRYDVTAKQQQATPGAEQAPAAPQPASAPQPTPPAPAAAPPTTAAQNPQ